MDFVTGVTLLTTVPAATTVAALHVMGKKNRAKVADDIRKGTAVALHKASTAAEKAAYAAELKLAEQKRNVVTISDYNGTGEDKHVNIDVEAVTFKKEIDDALDIKRRVEKNENRGYDDGPFKWGTPND